MSLDVFSIAAVSTRQDHWVLHQFAHDGALKFSWDIVPLHLLKSRDYKRKHGKGGVETSCFILSTTNLLAASPNAEN